MQVRTFDEESQKVTTLYDENGVVWFIAREICKQLEYKNTSKAIKDNCLSKGITHGYSLTNGGKQKSLLINEPNLYRLIMRSKSENAIKFQDWIYEKVIPSIRNTGSYSIPKSLKYESTKSRNTLTDTWKSCGIEKPYHYIQLTLQEYKSLGFEKGKKKKDFSKEQILLLSALESMESLKLFHDNKSGYYECRDSIYETAKIIPYKEKKLINN